MPLEQLILVRHGETVHNVAGIAQGWNDSALSDRGARQVSALAQRLANAGVTALYSSPLERAMSTARAIADATPPPIAPPDIVIVRITNGNTSAIAANGSTPSRPI